MQLAAVSVALVSAVAVGARAAQVPRLGVGVVSSVAVAAVWACNALAAGPPGACWRWTTGRRARCRAERTQTPSPDGYATRHQPCAHVTPPSVGNAPGVLADDVTALDQALRGG